MTTSSETPVRDVRFSEIIAPKFYGIHKAIRTGLCDGKPASTFWLKGGRGSTKSSFCAIEILNDVMRDPMANAIALRKVDNTVRTSLLSTFLWAMEKMQVSDKFDHISSPAEITYKKTGQKILLKGLEEPEKLKSIRLVKGYFKNLWFEETSEFNGIEEIRSVEQSILRANGVEGAQFNTFFSYNPPNDPNAWVNAECEIDEPGRVVHHSCYLDAPESWLGDKFIAKALLLKERDRIAYDHEYMGLAVGRADAVIFNGKWEEKEFETPKDARFFFGADWGHAASPTFITRSFEKDGCLYIDYESVAYGADLEDLEALFDAIPGARSWPIKADHSRPETISFVRRRGFNIAGAEKWEGCVEDGIAHLRGFKRIYIHPRCKQLIQAFALYCYKVDRITKDVLPIIVKKHDHGPDALRYSLDGYIQKRGGHGIWAKLAK